MTDDDCQSLVTWSRACWRSPSNSSTSSRPTLHTIHCSH